jgi:hypothetical protein
MIQQSNGSMDEPDDPQKGDTGSTRPEFGRRRALQLMGKLVEMGHYAADDLDQWIDCCRQIRDDPGSSKRDRLRATQTLRTLLGAMTDAAKETAKYERIDAGEATDASVQYVYEFREATQEDFDR